MRPFVGRRERDAVSNERCEYQNRSPLSSLTRGRQHFPGSD
jgi:hypothetical protein